ncbi:5950_t:CDS:2, partial [Rhizophagus irregularis]
MPPLPPILTQYIVKTDVKVNKSNLKTFCKPCIDKLGEEEGHKVTNEEKRENIFACLQPNNNTQNS